MIRACCCVLHSERINLIHAFCELCAPLGTVLKLASTPLTKLLETVV